MPLLSAIYTDPPVNFTPTFDPETTDYYANVPHNLHSVRVWGVAMSCRCEARSSTKHGSSRFVLDFFPTASISFLSV